LVDCPDCQASLKVHKTQSKKIYTLHLGGFTAQETLLQCNSCDKKTIYAAEELRRLAPPGSRFGYDVMVFVGKALFMRHRRAEEIIDELLWQNVRISASEIGYLGKKFVVYLALAHRQSAPRLQQAMREKGGYILHLDGTCEGRGPMLMSSLDSISEIVLGNVKVPSEKAAEIMPFLEEIKRRYGVPLAVVHDMGVGILAAVKKVFAGVPDFICHFHFLRDLGKDLLEKDYDEIRKRLRQHEITEKLRYRARQMKALIDQESDLIDSFYRSLQTDLPRGKIRQRNSVSTDNMDRFPLLCAYSLIQWALEGKTQGEGYGFPFDRPHVEFAKRLLVVYEQLEPIKGVHLRGQSSGNMPLLKLSRELEKVGADAELRQMLAAIDVKIQVFDQLRRAMRIAEKDKTAGLNSGSEQTAMGPIQKAVKKFHHKVTSRSDYHSNSGWKKMIAQIDKYWDKLFADPIAVEAANGRLLIQPQRTNNIMERFFRDIRRAARRKSGHNSISRFLQSMIAETPLVRNLDNPAYLKVLLNGHANLEDCFAHIDIDVVRQEMDATQQSLERVPRKIRELIAVPAFPEVLSRLFRKTA